MQKSLRKSYENGKNGEREATYVFDVHEEAMVTELVPKITSSVWKIFPSACGSASGAAASVYLHHFWFLAALTCIPFGLMLGWPSPTYPTLVDPESPVPINLNQSAMVAGFLMFGVSFGTIFSTRHIGAGPKYGIILGNVLIMLGWIIMWQAQDIYGLLASRFVLGTGHGYAMGQIKNYIKEMTEEALSVVLIKHLHFYGLVGFVLAYAMGPFVVFRQFSLISLIISVLILFLAIFLPSTPRELIRAKKIKDAKKLLLFLKPGVDPEQEIRKIVQNLSEPPTNMGIMKIMRHGELRPKFIKLTILLFCQQYGGGPPTLVYTQILFAKSHVPYAEYIALVYAVLFFIFSIVGTYVSPRYNKKAVLLISSCSVLILYICKILVIYFKVNEDYFSYSSVIVMYLFIVVYTLGLASIPFTLINDWFPKDYREFVTNYFVILFSIFALTITKIFQVLLDQFNVYIPFCLFSGVISFAIVFISIFIPYDITRCNQKVYKIGEVANCEDNQVKK